MSSYACEFTNPALEQLYNDADEAGAVNLIYGTVALAFYQLAIGAVQMTNFRQGETQENDSVIFDRLWALYERWNNKAGLPTPLPVFAMHPLRLQYIDFPEDLNA